MFDDFLEIRSQWGHLNRGGWPHSYLRCVIRLFFCLNMLGQLSQGYLVILDTKPQSRWSMFDLKNEDEKSFVPEKHHVSINITYVFFYTIRLRHLNKNTETNKKKWCSSRNRFQFFFNLPSTFNCNSPLYIKRSTTLWKITFTEKWIRISWKLCCRKYFKLTISMHLFKKKDFILNISIKNV